MATAGGRDRLADPFSHLAEEWSDTVVGVAVRGHQLDAAAPDQSHTAQQRDWTWRNADPVHGTLRTQRPCSGHAWTAEERVPWLVSV